MKKIIKYLPGMHMFFAGIMFVCLIDQLIEGDMFGGVLSFVIMAANMYSYFDIENNYEFVR